MATYEVLSVNQTTEEGDYVTLAVRFNYKDEPKQFDQEILGVPFEEPGRGEYLQNYADSLERDVILYWDSLDNPS